jgi:dihydroneopterin triphosphate diphosphatase
MAFKIPLSVLVVIHTPDLQVLLLERADKEGYWQSVTGSLDLEDELPEAAAAREVAEETGIDARRFRLSNWSVENRFEIYAWRLAQYAPGITHNTEYTFGLCVPSPCEVTLAPREHVRYAWLPYREAAGKCFSYTNRDAILMLPDKAVC